MYYAHSTKEADRSNWHALREHLEATAKLSGQFGQVIGIAAATHLAGLMHDLGKYSPKFQARLKGATERVDHSTAGASIVLEMAKGRDRHVAELIAYAIAGHHAGLPDKHGEAHSTLHARLNAFSAGALNPMWQEEIRPNASDLMPGFNWDEPRLNFQFAFLGRMLFSCLVDADYKDTEAFYARVEKRQVDRQWASMADMLDGLRSSFEQHMMSLGDSDTAVNRLRAEILRHVRSRAEEKPGFFTLTVPTGGGKTLSSLGFALDHAKAHRHSRIIYAIPFTAIIDQTAQIFRKVLGPDVVLEHHSSIEEEEISGEGRQRRDKLKLAMEDWAAPVVVTTNVQLFESLFAARPSRCRKLHNIANSILILDEAQTLPRHLLAPAVAALRELVRNYRCTIVLCTATQPALDQRRFAKDHALGLPLEGRELAPDPPQLAMQLKRIQLRQAGPMNDEALVAALAEVEQGLIIVNTRNHALVLYRRAREAGLDGLIHLTTRQYAAHRQEVLAEVRARLQEGQPCRLIATSLVEAGVDLDFPRVWRAEAGLDQIVQAAGRCNREGKRPADQSIVTIFTAPEHAILPELKGLSGDMGRIMRKHGDLLSPAAIEDFFGEVYWRVGKEGIDRKNILEDFRIGNGETNFAYRTVAEKFQMIESAMVPVIVAQALRAREAVSKLAFERIPSGSIARELQRYIVQVPSKARSMLINSGHVRFAESRLRGDQFAVLQYDGLYDSEVGLLWDMPEYLKVEDTII
jgi:CRISPR-associated endonuclease/helicase Cas3